MIDKVLSDLLYLTSELSYALSEFDELAALISELMEGDFQDFDKIVFWSVSWSIQFVGYI